MGTAGALSPSRAGITAARTGVPGRAPVRIVVADRLAGALAALPRQRERPGPQGDLGRGAQRIGRGRAEVRAVLNRPIVVDRKFADELMVMAMKAAAVGAIQRWLIYVAVRRFGGGAYRRQNLDRYVRNRSGEDA